MHHLRAVCTSSSRRLGGRPRVSKIDPRHFFHTLRVGRRWHKYFGHPPLDRGTSPESFPLQTWAQGVNDVSTARAGLDSSTRLIDSAPPPAALPLWVSILDDVWALEEEPARGAEDGALVGPKWLGNVCSEWCRMGIDTSVKKTVRGSCRAEVQGVLVDGVTHRLGVGPEKLWLMLEAGLTVVAQAAPRLRTVQRLVGKLSFAMTFKVGDRSLVFDIFREMAAAERAKVRRMRL